MDTNRRQYYPTKSAWAMARASELRQEARLLPTCWSADWRGIQRRTAAIRSITAEARRFEAMAERFRRAGA